MAWAVPERCSSETRRHIQARNNVRFVRPSALAWKMLPPSQPTDSMRRRSRMWGREGGGSDGRPVQVHEVRKDVTEVHELLWGADEEGLMLPRQARLDL